MRVCHLNTCPVGIATQDPELRKKFAGKPEHVINFMFFIAEEVREFMAELGFRKFEDMVGRSDLLEFGDVSSHWKAKHLDLSVDPAPARQAIGECCDPQRRRSRITAWTTSLDQTAADLAWPSPPSSAARRCTHELPIKNTNRTVGTTLSGEIAKKYGFAGLPDDTITFKFNGSAGQSFGCFLAKGITLLLEGDANDYVGKGLSGGRIAVFPPRSDRTVQGRGEHHRRQHHRLRRDRRRDLPPRRGRRTLLRPQLRRQGRRRRLRRSRLRVHDRRPGRRHRPDRPQLRRGHERRHRLRLRHDDAASSPACATRTWSTLEKPDKHRRRPATLRRLLENHVKLHRQHRRQGDPGRLGQGAKHFVKVMPKDYRRVLEHQAEMEARAAACPSVSRRCVMLEKSK